MTGFEREMDKKSDLNHAWVKGDLVLDARMEAVSRMAREFSHSLGTPLSVVLSNSERLVSRLQDRPDLLPYLEDILSVSRSSAKMIQIIAELSRSFPVTQQIVEVHSLIHSLKESLNENHPELEIELNLKADLDHVKGDPQALTAAILFVLENSVEAMSGAGRICIQSTRLDSKSGAPVASDLPQDWLEISIVDSGPGMDAVSLALAVDPFFTTHESKKNAGLGLSRAYSIARAHGGRIRLQSRVQEGTTVGFILPLNKMT